jgi:hypothetical protein
MIMREWKLDNSDEVGFAQLEFIVSQLCDIL